MLRDIRSCVQRSFHKFSGHGGHKAEAGAQIPKHAAKAQECVAWRRRTNQPDDKSKMIAIAAENFVVFAGNCMILAEIGVSWGAVNRRSET